MRRWIPVMLALLMAAPANAEVVPEETLTLNFQNADLDTVLAFFTQATGKIFVKSESVHGSVTVATPAPVNRAEATEILQSVLETRGFTLAPSGGRVVRVLTLAEAAQGYLDDGGSDAAGEGMITQVIPLKFLAVSDIRADLAPLLSRGGNIIADPRSNALVVTDVASNVRRLIRVLAALDVRSPQVLIEALMVEVSLTTENKLGFEWGHAGSFEARGHSFNESTSADFNLGSFITEGLRTAVIRSDGQLSGVLRALATDNRVNILSTPHVMAVNNQPALIRVGEEIPVLTQTRNIQGGETIRSFDFKQVAIELEVTPRISPDRDVYLKVHPLVKKILGYNAELNAPILATREAQTAVQVRDGDTIVIGGLMKDDRSTATSRIPLLGDIPLLGWLFGKRGSSREKTELLVFITPRVVMGPEDGQKVTQDKEAETRAQPTPNRERARALYLEGRRLERSKKFGDAVAAYRAAATVSPDGGFRRRCEKRATRAARKSP